MHDGYIDTHPALVDYAFTPVITIRGADTTLPYSVTSLPPAFIDISEASSVLMLKDLEATNVEMFSSPPASRTKPNPSVCSLV